jgi:hypothetical protein
LLHRVNAPAFPNWNVTDMKGNKKAGLVAGRKAADGADRADHDAAPVPHRGLASLSTDLQAHIGSRLRAYYDGIVREPVPDRLLELLKQLEQTEKEAGRPGGDDESPGP